MVLSWHSPKPQQEELITTRLKTLQKINISEKPFPHNALNQTDQPFFCKGSVTS
jgi:hypothetical protein